MKEWKRKYRIVEKNGQFYPQKKNGFLWGWEYLTAPWYIVLPETQAQRLLQFVFLL